MAALGSGELVGQEVEGFNHEGTKARRRILARKARENDVFVIFVSSWFKSYFLEFRHDDRDTRGRRG
jgi:hypothetical protein